MAAFLLWTLEAANCQDFNNCPLSRLSLCLSCPALVHVCSHTLAQFSQWSCAKITHLCWTKQHIGLQAAKSMGITHPKYSSLGRSGPAWGFCVKIVKKVSGAKKNIYPSVLVWNEKLTAPCKNESLDFFIDLFFKTIWNISNLLSFYRSCTQNNKRCVFITLSHNWNMFSTNAEWGGKCTDTGHGKGWGAEFLLHTSFYYQDWNSSIPGPKDQGIICRMETFALVENDQVREHLRKLDKCQSMGPDGMYP